MSKRLDKNRQRELFYEIYDAVYPLSLPWDKKYRGFEWLIEDAGCDLYPIDGVTVDALEHMEAQGWGTYPKGIKRGHGHGRLERQERAKALFDGEVSHEDAFDFFFDHELVTICTATENGSKEKGTAHWSPVLPLPIELFGWRTGWSVRLNKSRKAYLQGVLKEWRQSH